MPDPTLATEDPTIVGARVQALFVGRKERGDHLPPRARPAAAVQAGSPADATVEDQVVLLRAQVSAALELHDNRIAALESLVEAASGRSARVIAAAQALAAELDRLTSSLPADLALELEGSIERFAARLSTA